MSNSASPHSGESIPPAVTTARMPDGEQPRFENAPKSAPLIRNWNILKIVALYILVSGLWIVFSDRVAVLLVPDPATLQTINTLKGWGYVLFMAVMLYELIRRYTVRLLDMHLQSAAALRAAEEKYRNIVENAIEGFFQTTPEGHYLAANPALARLYGYDSPAELMAEVQDIRRQTYVDQKRRDEFVRRLDEDGEIHGFENQVYRRDGSVIWVRSNARAVRDAAGAILYYEGSLVDITESKHIEEALRENSEFSQEIINSAREGIIVTDRSLQCLVWNPFMEQLTGRPARQAIGHSIAEFFPKWVEQGLNLYAAQALSGQPSTLPELPFSFSTIEQTDWVEYKFNPLHDAEQQIIGLILTINDITERKQAEEAQTQLAAIVQSSEDAIIGKTLDGIITSWNQGAEKLYGYSAPEIIGRSIDILMPPDRRVELTDILNRLKRGESIEHFETVRVRRDGHRLDMSVTISPIRDSAGQISGASSIARDITERKQAEETLRESEEHYREAIAAAGLVPYLIDYKTRRFTFLGENILKLTGYSAEEFTPDKLRDSVQDNVVWGSDNTSLTLDEAQLKFLSGKIRHWANDLRIRTRTGEERWLSDVSVPLRDEQGRVTSAIGVFQDLTDRKRIEQAERDQRALAEALRDSALALNSTLEFDEVLDRIFESVKKVVSLDSLNIMLRESNAFRVVRYHSFGKYDVSTKGLPELFRLTDFANLREIVATGQPQLIADTRNYPGWLTLSGREWIRSFLSVPIVIDSVVTGLINVNAAQPNFYTTSHLTRLQALADQVALALKNARLMNEAKERTQELKLSQDQLRAVSVDAETIREAERLSISREIHDDLGQSLTGLKMDLAWLMKQLSTQQPQADLPGKLQDMSNLIDQMIQSVRRIATELRPSVLDDLGLIAAIEWQTSDFRRRASLKCELTSNVTDSALNSNQATAIYRIFLEMLTNVARHAQATHVQIKVNEIDGTFTLDVLDNGRGVSPEALDNLRSVGIAGMRERALSVGGTFSLSNRAEGGTRARVCVPLERS